jgi:hypothetical protein
VCGRWNGASPLDFQHLRRVDHLNGSDVSRVIAEVAANYHTELTSNSLAGFQAYILSMWRRIHHTADIFAGSSLLHFVLVARSLEEEVAATFQILALLYLHPLARYHINSINNNGVAQSFCVAR